MPDDLYNLAFERSVLSSIVFEPDNFQTVYEKLTEEDFYLPTHQDIFKVLMVLKKNDKPIDEEFIKKELLKIRKFDEQVMLEILSANPIANLAAYIQEIKEKSLSRQTLRLAGELTRFVLDGSHTSEDIIKLLSIHTDEQTKSISSLLPSNFNELIEQLSDVSLLSVPKDLQPIESTKFFFHGGLHVIHGLSKAGKTYFTLEMLNGVKNMQVIWIDGDANDLALTTKFKNIKHLAPLSPDTYLDKFLNVKIDYSKVIFVIDSLKDFKNGEELDSNNGMDTIIKRFKQLSKMGATVIVIHHSTLKRGVKDKPNEIKIKGNEEAIYSNSDITYLYKRDWETNIAELICERSRVGYIKSGSIFKTNSYDASWSLNTEELIVKKVDTA